MTSADHQNPDPKTTLFDPPAYENGHKPYIKSYEEYQAMYKQSIEQPDVFFGKMGNELISWSKPFTAVRHGGFKDGDVAWFLNGHLNVSYNCVDRHAFANPDKVAIIWESDNGDSEKITYSRLLQDVCRFANVLKKYGVRRGDIVGIYMPMVPEAAVAMLACARLGAIHSVVFAGFSADALRDRLLDAKCRLLVTADQGLRGGKVIQLKSIADQAVDQCPDMEHVIVFQRTGDMSVPFNPSRDKWWHEEVANQRPYCPAEEMNSEDPLFMLYTSGSTGKPKGLLHTQAGYLLGAVLSTKYVFDVHPNDVYGCMADVGWITGHSYIVYGPLGLGATTVMFESVPTYPHAGRYWEMVDKHQITQLYTAPTAIRALRRLGDEPVAKFSLKSLRVLGSVGEPINPEAWLWYYNVVGRQRCMIVDTYWQTETGSHLITPVPGVSRTKPGSATTPFFGIELAILDPETGKELEGNNVTGVLAIRKPFPSMARTVYENHKRYLDTYLKPYHGYYFTGDGATRDEDGFYWVEGRVDDVINVAGHRMSTAEIESALVSHVACAEAAVVGINDEVTGQAVFCFCTIKAATADFQALSKAFVSQVRSHIGPFATPKKVVIVPDLPKTRSGKIMRRILRKVAGRDVTVADLDLKGKIEEVLGDISTLADPEVVPTLIRRVSEQA